MFIIVVHIRGMKSTYKVGSMSSSLEFDYLIVEMINKKQILKSIVYRIY